ncbi:hypothetical protein [Gordonia crocea]|uniref:Uncharacterized protein n=1 Tax=Gordonia crocea TaxID=589162 RepID=A0A7I9UYW6_9ACTN|nr:hypothetical protein [Gordonia crocea]GED98021.1 hypothetical protein nbrc107697_20600 [Gordonia crocea]
MRDENLLVAALQDTGAIVEHREANAIQVRWRGVGGALHRDAQGIWQAVFTGDVDQQKAVGIVQALDQAYGRRVQQTVVERLKARAPQAGMSVMSEKLEDDSTVTLILDVDEVTA